MWARSRAAFSTLVRMKPRQLQARLFRRLRYHYVYPVLGGQLFPVPHPIMDGASAPDQPFCEQRLAQTRACSTLLHRAHDLARHRFSFLNLPTYAAGTPVQWHAAPHDDPLWSFTLHYWEWALDLAHAWLLTQDTVFREAIVDLMADWLAANPVGKEPGWLSYALSRRLVAWSRLDLALAQDARWRQFWREHVAPSVQQQANFLLTNLEHDLMNNHLLSNYRALAWTGLLYPGLPGAEALQQVGLAGLWHEMRRQVLDDGFHDERSISYHVHVLQDLLETWWLAKRLAVEVPDDVLPMLRNMHDVLAATQAPDGSWPLVNDSVAGYPMEPQAILEVCAALLGPSRVPLAAEPVADPAYRAWFTDCVPGEPESVRPRGWRPVSIFSQGGYGILRDVGGHYLLLDAGPLGPAHMPGHGHADVLSIVLYGAGRPLIVDPGVYTYHAPYWRNHFRSTAAHNTVTVDGQSQCEFWGAFRVAFAPSARLTEWSAAHLCGEHNGYTVLSAPVIHRRHVTRQEAGDWLLTDHFVGSGEHDFALALQFAPGASASLEGVHCAVQWPDGVRLHVTVPDPLPGATARLEPGWVATGWNLKDDAPRYVLAWRAGVPCTNRVRLQVSPAAQAGQAG
ncbi:MAG: alginate lyase family protein [Anaerolineae bacterium]|nr:alginate lyase family protein [Anaerolineae bacterium]